jgi:hypothetical protein
MYQKSETTQLSQTDKANAVILSAALKKVLWTWGLIGLVTGPIVWRYLIRTYLNIQYATHVTPDIQSMKRHPLMVAWLSAAMLAVCIGVGYGYTFSSILPLLEFPPGTILSPFAKRMFIASLCFVVATIVSAQPRGLQS